jgi:nucleoside-diphosphate-sugar epimerase
MKVLVTGASGFVGGHLVPALVTAGHEVVALVREPSSYEVPDGVNASEADLSLPLEELPKVDAVVHLAQANVRFPSGARELFRVNAGSTVELLDHARVCAAGSFVLASTASVYGLGDRPFHESDPLAGGDFYALSKIAAEGLVDQYRPFFSTHVLRLVAPYGPGQSGRMIPRLVERVSNGEPVTLSAGGHPRLNPIYVDDVIRVFLNALETPDHTLVNVGGDEPVGVRELAELIGSAVGRKPVFEERADGAAGDVVADTSRLKELFPIDPLVQLADGLKRTVAAG